MKEEISSTKNMEEEKQQQNFGNYYLSNMLLQGPCEFLDELISTILRCLGLQQDSPPPSPPSPPPPPTTITTTTDDVAAACTDVTTTIPSSSSTTTVIDNGGDEETTTISTTSVGSSGVIVIVPSSTPVIDDGEKGEVETTCPTPETPDVGGAGDGGGSASQPGGEGDYFPPIDTEGGLVPQPKQSRIRVPPRPGVSTGKGGQTH